MRLLLLLLLLPLLEVAAGCCCTCSYSETGGFPDLRAPTAKQELPPIKISQ